MADLNKRRALRDALLLAVYENDDGTPAGWLDYAAWAEEHGHDPGEVRQAAEWLKGRDYVADEGWQPSLSIKPQGIEEAERLTEESQRAGEAAVVLAVLTVEQRREVEAVLGQIRKLVDSDDQLPPETRDEIEGDLNAATDYSKHERVRSKVMGAMLTVLVFSLKAAIAWEIGVGAQTAIARLDQLVQHLLL